ncbi:MAG TPA: hypothetical protein VM100_11385 [Longimicrobiales bacterium]|nr:hypothetical protein [Longimicrobiales bacterium]
MKKIGAAIMLVTTGGCMSLQPVANPEAFLAKKQPSFIVVTTPEHALREEALIFHGPVIEHGTLSGMVFNEQTSVPVTQVRTVMARQFDSKKTTYAVLIGSVVVGSVGWLMSQSGNGKASAYDNPNCGHQTSCYVPPNTLPKASPLPR